MRYGTRGDEGPVAAAANQVGLGRGVYFGYRRNTQNQRLSFTMESHQNCWHRRELGSVGQLEDLEVAGRMSIAQSYGR